MKMNTKIKKSQFMKFAVASLVAFTLALIFVIAPTPASATVGGPTYISQLATDDASVNLYYIVNDNGGRGCPPIIHKTTLANENDIEVKTCEEIEAAGIPGNATDYAGYNAFIADTYEDLRYLSSINLKKNHINIAVKVLSEKKEGEDFWWTEFRATVTQDGKELAKIPFRGCSADQPHIFEGYMIPSTGGVASNTMALLISNKGDCFEGGYVREDVHIVKGVKYLDTTPVRSFKDATATEPNVGNVVVYAGGNGGDNTIEGYMPYPDKTAGIDNGRNMLINGALLLVGIIVGSVVGHAVWKRKRA